MRDGIIVVRQQKTGATLAIPVHPELQKILDATPSEHLTFLTTRTARPFTPADFTNWFKAKCREAGLPKQASVHGLRKAACRRLAEAGCSANVIASISGHASLREVERYTKAADQERMARQGIKAISGTKEQQPVANLAEGLPIRDKKS
jgi:integrase